MDKLTVRVVTPKGIFRTLTGTHTGRTNWLMVTGHVVEQQYFAEIQNTGQVESSFLYLDASSS